MVKCNRENINTKYVSIENSYVINSHGGNIQLGKSKYNGLKVKITLPF